KPRRYINLTLTGGTRSIHLQRIVAHDRLLRFCEPPASYRRTNVLMIGSAVRVAWHWGVIEGKDLSNARWFVRMHFDRALLGGGDGVTFGSKRRRPLQRAQCRAGGA